jgi:ADP-glucose pyrophosphorylase
LQVQDSIISHGCFLRDCSVKHSVVGVRSRLERGVQLEVYRVKQRQSKPLLASLILY